MNTLISVDYFLLINKSSLHTNLGKTRKSNAPLKACFRFTPSPSQSLSPHDELEKKICLFFPILVILSSLTSEASHVPPDSRADTPPGRMCTLRAKVGSVSGMAGSQCGSTASGSPTLPGSQTSSSGL